MAKSSIPRRDGNAQAYRPPAPEVRRIYTLRYRRGQRQLRLVLTLILPADDRTWYCRYPWRVEEAGPGGWAPVPPSLAVRPSRKVLRTAHRAAMADARAMGYRVGLKTIGNYRWPVAWRDPAGGESA